MHRIHKIHSNAHQLHKYSVVCHEFPMLGNEFWAYRVCSLDSFLASRSLKLLTYDEALKLTGDLIQCLSMFERKGFSVYGWSRDSLVVVYQNTHEFSFMYLGFEFMVPCCHNQMLFLKPFFKYSKEKEKVWMSPSVERISILPFSLSASSATFGLASMVISLLLVHPDSWREFLTDTPLYWYFIRVFQVSDSFVDVHEHANDDLINIQKRSNDCVGFIF